MDEVICLMPSSFSDPEFLKRLKQKDEDTWTDFYSTVTPRLKYYIRQKVNDFKKHWDVNATTEDIVQVTFEKALKNIHTYNPKKSMLVTWIFTIANNTFIDSAKELQPQKSKMERWLKAFMGNKNTQMVATVEELCNNMKINMDSFTEKQKAYFDMFYVQEWSDDLIAEKMEVSRNAVVKMRGRILSQLRDLLEKNSA